MNKEELIPHLFRTEFRKLTSVLCKLFGIEHIELAEDIASDTFLQAFETWTYKGIPANPTAWLYAVAKNKAKNQLQRNQVFAKRIGPVIRSDASSYLEPEIDLSPQNINDSQLQMMFAICHPSIPPEAQIGLSLRILCGFGIDEIADAFLTNKETINKRLFRAKERLREEQIKIELPEISEIESRLDTVLTTIYLLFNEGYYSVSQNKTLRKDLCLEAMRLCYMLIENKNTNKPGVNALLSLMCFHASRFDARIDKDGELVLYEEQDTSLWNTELISRGGYFLHCSANGDSITRYHLEANIAFWNTQKSDTREKWENMLDLYDQLLSMVDSPFAALNRAFAVSKLDGKASGIKEAEKLNMKENQFYFALLGELYNGIDNEKSKENFRKAQSLARTQTDKNAIERKLMNIA
ncbi:MAG: RNA polymerase sigma factor [Chitinophagales bacterium]